MKSEMNLKEHNLAILLSLILATAIFYCLQQIPTGTSVFEMSKEMKSMPLLLSSQLVKCTQAKINVVLLFDEGEIPDTIISELPLIDWEWKEKRVAISNGIQQTNRVILTGSSIVNIQTETELGRWYPVLAKKVMQAGGRIYLDERIPEQIDIAAFLSALEARPLQWDLSGNTYSVAAWQKDIDLSVSAGADEINVQMITRTSEQGEITSLAYPVLLGEF